jgi:hypothetical protein
MVARVGLDRLVSPSGCLSAHPGRSTASIAVLVPEVVMVVCFRIGTLLIVIALVALFVGFFAPELRSLDRNARVIFAVVGIITALFVVSFTPVWLVLFWLRSRSRRGLRFRAVDYVAVFVAFFLGLGILAAICFAIRVLVVK